MTRRSQTASIWRKEHPDRADPEEGAHEVAREGERREAGLKSKVCF